MALDHSLGVPHVRETIRPGGFYDYEYMVGLIAKEPAFWEPGSRHGYHGLSFAWTVGELVRRGSRGYPPVMAEVRFAISQPKI